MSFQACQSPSRSQINGLIWLNNSKFIPQELCDREPELKLYGWYRRLNNGKIEFFSYCDKMAPDMVSMFNTEFQALMEQYIRKD